MVNLRALVEERGVLLAPSVLSADLWRLEDGVCAIEAGGADLIHLDVMDGVFVPNISMGFPLLNALKDRTSLPLDVHLMIVEPERYVEGFVKAGASIVSFQVEATYHPHRVLGMIREAGAQAGIVLNPGTPVEAIENLLEEADMVLVMSVIAGVSAIRRTERRYPGVWSTSLTAVMASSWIVLAVALTGVISPAAWSAAPSAVCPAAWRPGAKSRTS